MPGKSKTVVLNRKIAKPKISDRRVSTFTWTADKKSDMAIYLAENISTFKVIN
jgi:hypothetical protein